MVHRLILHVIRAVTNMIIRKTICYEWLPCFVELELQGRSGSLDFQSLIGLFDCRLDVAESGVLRSCDTGARASRGRLTLSDWPFVAATPR